MARVEIDFKGIKRYFDDEGELHRDGGPAKIYLNGTKEWSVNGKWKMTWHSYGSVYVKQSNFKTFWQEPNGIKQYDNEDCETIWPEL